MKLDDYLRALVERGGSDLHLKVGRPPLMRIKGELIPTEYPVMSKENMRELLFPTEQQHQVRAQLAMTLCSTVSQRLIKKSDGSGRVAVIEVMINTPTIKKMIEEGRTDAIDKAIHDSASLYKMQTMNQHLFHLVKEGVITQESALSVSNNPNDLKIMFQTQMPEAEAKPAQKPSPLGQRPSGLEGKYGR